MAVRGKVYNITPYLHFHPGGIDELMRAAGADGTKLFNEVHQWVNYESMLQKCQVGFLVPDNDEDDDEDEDGDHDGEGDAAGNEGDTATRRGLSAAAAAGADQQRSLPSLTLGVSSGSSSPVFLTPAVPRQQQQPKSPLGVRIDWHQTNTDVVATFYLRGVKQDEVSFGGDSQSFKISINSEAVTKVQQDSAFFSATYPLERKVRDAETEVKVGVAKVEVILKKADEGVRWNSLGERGMDSSTHLDSITTSTPTPPSFFFKILLLLLLSFSPTLSFVFPRAGIYAVYHPCEILEIKQLSYNVAVFRLGYSSDLAFRFSLGYHLSLKAVESGRPIFRNYTPIGPLDFGGGARPAGDGHYVDLLIKLYPDGQMSRYLSGLEVGDRSLCFSAPTGSFSYESVVRLSRPPHGREGPLVGIIAAGTGITPMMGVIERFLGDRERRGQMRILFANREERDIIYRDQLAAWEAEAGEARFRVSHVLTLPPANWPQLSGRISKEMIDAHLPKAHEKGYVLVCGPPTFTSLMMKYLIQLDFHEKMLHAFT